MMKTTARWFDQIIGWACQAVLYLTTAAIFVILSANVILRYTTGTSVQWASELPELLFPWLVISGIVLAVQHGSHISVVILTQRLPKQVRAWVLTAGGVLIVALYATLAWAAWELMGVAADELSPMLHVPGSVTVGGLMVGFILIAILTLLHLGDAFADVASTSAEPATETAKAHS